MFAVALLLAAGLDGLLENYARASGVPLGPPVSDAAYARRVYLDVWGLLPAPEQLAEFERDGRPDKRQLLVERLLADGARFAAHWISFWNDHLRNDEGVVYHGERKTITPWLRKALEDNLPYDKFLQALLNPASKDDPEGFLIGVNWRGDISASQVPYMQAAQNSAQVFLGVNLKCNSCHDSFISKWKLKDAYGLAAFFSEGLPEIHRCDVATGEKTEPKFLYPELGGVAPEATLAEKRAAAARLFTSVENRRTPRTYVNRIWKALLGRGLIEPPDEMDAKAWSPELLEWLTNDFVEHGYDPKHLLLRIMTSRAYGLPSVREAPEKPYVFRGPLPRRLSAEQFLDAASSITGEWRLLAPRQAAPAAYAREWQLKSSPLSRAMGRPIRDQVVTERLNQPTTLAALELVNGDTLATLLYRGARRMLGELRPPPASRFDSGVVSSAKAVVDIDITGASQLWLLVEDVDSYDPSRVVAGWGNATLTGPAGPVPLSQLKPVETVALHVKGEQVAADAVAAPVPSALVFDIAGRAFSRFQAVAGVDQSSLASDISPRIRFFVFTEDPDRGQLLAVAGEPPVARPPAVKEPEALIARLYRHALGREASAEEARLARECVVRDGKISSDGLEDLLWSLLLSPEFQYVR